MINTTNTKIKSLILLLTLSLSSTFLTVSGATLTPTSTSTPIPSPTTTITPTQASTPTSTPSLAPTQIVTVTITPTSATPTVIPTKVPTATVVIPVQNTAKLNDLKQRAIKEIEKRINIYNTLIQKLESNQLIAEDLKVKFKAELQKEIAELNSLKVKIQGSNNATTLKNEVNILIQSYKLYGFYNSQIRILLARENLNNAINKLNNLEPKLKSRIQELELNNKDVTELQKSYDKIIVRIQDAQSQIQKVETIVKPLKLENYPNNKTNLQEGRDNLKKTQQSIKDAFKEAENIINLLEKA